MITKEELLAGSYPASGNTFPLCVDCGLIPYGEALSLQRELHDRVARGELPSLILFLEHPPAITLGLNTKQNKLLFSAEELSERGIEVVSIRRGGGATAHNPGQLVIYPILHLPTYRFRVAPFVHYLEQIGIDLLAQCSLKSERIARYPGLWVEGRKIASVGVQLSHSVSMHGIAINIANDLTLFDAMVPCGIDGVEMTSVKKEKGNVLSMDILKKHAERLSGALIPQFSRPLKEQCDE